MDKDYPLVLVRWYDARIDTEWTSVSQVLNEETSPVESYGLLIKKTRKLIILAQTIAHSDSDEREPHILARMKIPRQWVMEIVPLGIIDK